jgi:hypothetical protein
MTASNDAQMAISVAESASYFLLLLRFCVGSPG